MKNNKKNMEERTSSRIKNLGFDEPSPDFTQKVMQSILKADRPAYALRPGKSFWLMGLIPVIMIICWYLLVLFQMTGYIDRLWISVNNSVQLFLSRFISFFIQLKNISIQPTILISFITVLSLLIIEEVVSLTKRLL
jgi:hypothetical protein